jgi:two-component system response regulator NreC
VGPNHRTIKIIIADRSLLFRSGLRSLLLAEPDMAVLADSGEFTETIAQSRICKPDVLVLDASLMDAGRVATLRELKCAVLVLAQEETDEALQLAMHTRATAYMLKGGSPSELVAGIRHTAQLCGQETRPLSNIVPDLQALRASTENRRGAELTARECEVLRLLAGGRTAREASQELGVSTKTIEAHKLNLMRKLDVHNRASLIACASACGLIPEAVSQ